MGKRKDKTAHAGEPRIMLTRKQFEKELRKLHVELCKLQEWI